MGGSPGAVGAAVVCRAGGPPGRGGGRVRAGRLSAGQRRRGIAVAPGTIVITATVAAVMVVLAGEERRIGIVVAAVAVPAIAAAVISTAMPVVAVILVTVVTAAIEGLAAEVAVVVADIRATGVGLIPEVAIRRPIAAMHRAVKAVVIGVVERQVHTGSAIAIAVAIAVVVIPVVTGVVPVVIVPITCLSYTSDAADE